MNAQGHLYQHLGNGIWLILTGVVFVLLAFYQKSPTKILGMSYRVFASIVGMLFAIYGIISLTGLL